jgi:hypothetical protein
MSLTITLRKYAALAALTATAASAGLAGTAAGATIGAPEVLMPGARIPIDFAGYREPANDRLPANHRIVRVHVEIAPGERAQTVLTAPKGFRLVTIGIGSGERIGAAVTDAHYAGKRSVRVRLYVNPNKVTKDETGRGTLYLLARRA